VIAVGLPYGSRSFDYIHQRFVGSGIPTEQWPSVLEDFYRVLRPGGYLEILETNTRIYNAGPISKRIYEMVHGMGRARGIDMLALDKLTPLIKKAGFVKVDLNSKHMLSMGSWAGEVGGGFLKLNMGVIRSMYPYAERLGLCQPGEMEDLLSKWEEECNRLKSYQIFWLYTARKPS
jgi:hypothetical protein